LSSLALPRLPGPVLYGLAALLALFELGIAWQALHPNVPADYRAYYIDQSTTCLNQPVPGTYAQGIRIPFRSGYEKLITPLRVCGWEGPAGDGLHAVGESARLRLALLGSAHDVQLTLEMVAVDFAGTAGQPVDVIVNGTRLGRAQVRTGLPQAFEFAVPDAALGPRKVLDVELAFPDAIRVDPQDSNTRKRSIKLVAVQAG
jgi:hypothetical protein